MRGVAQKPPAPRRCDECGHTFVPEQNRQRMHRDCGRAREKRREQQRKKALAQTRRSPLRGRNGGTIVEHRPTRQAAYQFRPDFVLAFAEMRREFVRQVLHADQSIAVLPSESIYVARRTR